MLKIWFAKFTSSLALSSNENHEISSLFVNDLIVLNFECWQEVLESEPPTALFILVFSLFNVFVLCFLRKTRGQ